MNRKERRNLQRQGVQVPKDPTLNIKLSALGKSIMTPGDAGGHDARNQPAVP